MLPGIKWSQGNITKLHRNILIFVCLLVVAGVAGCGTSPGAPNAPSQSGEGLVEKLTLDELALRADSVLVGEVTDIACYEEGKGNIYTLVTLSIDQRIKGETEGEANIRVPGGEVNGRALGVEGAPSFQLGERTVVFLNKGEGVFTVVGGFQGKFTIDKNNMVGGTMSLTEFIDQIRDILEKQ